MIRRVRGLRWCATCSPYAGARSRRGSQGASFGGDRVTSDLLTAHWRLGDGRTLWLTANLSDRDIPGAPEPKGTAIWGRALSGNLPGWAARWHIG